MDSIKITSKLVSFESVTPSDNGALEYLVEILNRMGFTSEILEFGHKNKKIKNLFSFFKGGDGPNICFAGHTDVVPPGDIDAWTNKPFKATIMKNKIYGRGVVDMKGAIAAFLASTSRLLSEFKMFNGTISLLVTGDEEGEAEFGTKKVIEWLRKKKIKIDYCVVGEPTNPKKLGEMIKIGRRGSLNGTLTVFGKQGHVAYPESAENPIPMLMKYCKSLLKPLDAGNNSFQPSNLEITSIDSSNHVDNLIPRKIYAKFNVRFNDKFTERTLIREIKNRLNSVGKNYKLETKCSGESFLNLSEALTKNMSSSIHKILRIRPKLSTNGGTSDARFISRICPVIEFGLVGQTMHQINENCKINDITNLSRIYFEFLKKTLNTNT